MPGDPYEVRALARRLRRTADAIKEQTEALQRLYTDEFWDSVAGREFRGTARETATKLDAAYARYDAAAEAVDGYAPALEDAQRSADAALLRAQEADEHRRKAQATVDGFCGPVTAQDPRIVAAQRFADEASQEIDRARSEVDRAVESRHAAARHAATAIRIAIKDDRLTDHRMDHVKQWIHENADWITQLGNIAGWVASACAIASLLVGWIPVIGQALAAVLTAVGLIASAVAIICHLALVLSGDGSWVDLAIDAVGLVTFGLGRVAATGVKSSVAGLRASGKCAAAAERMSSLLPGALRHSPQVLKAFTLKDLGPAARLTGMPAKTLRGARGNAWGEANKLFGPGGQRGTRAARDAFLEQGAFPKGRLQEALHPGALLRDTKDGVKVLLQRDSWVQAKTELRLSGFHSLLGPELAGQIDELRALTKPLSSDGVVRLARSAVTVHVGALRGATLTALGVDWADKFGGFDSWKT